MSPRKTPNNVPDHSERPDDWYWKADHKERRKVSREDLEKLTEQVGEYDRKRFALGRRFRLCRGYHGVPRGTCCTVVDTWPRTRVRWDRWAKTGYGSLRRKEDMHIELDSRLAYVEK